MKIKYNGYEVDVKREDCLGGWSQLYYSVYRLSDGLCVIDSFEDSEETVRDMMGYMKGRVDDFIKSKGASEKMESDY